MKIEDFSKEVCSKCLSYYSHHPEITPTQVYYSCCRESELTQAQCKIRYLLNINHNLEEEIKSLKSNQTDNFYTDDKGNIQKWEV